PRDAGPARLAPAALPKPPDSPTPYPAAAARRCGCARSVRLHRGPDGGPKVGEGEGLLQERCGPKGPRLGPRVLIGERRDQDEGHGQRGHWRAASTSSPHSSGSWLSAMTAS